MNSRLVIGQCGHNPADIANIRCQDRFSNPDGHAHEMSVNDVRCA
jgi:hypothetical protein